MKMLLDDMLCAHNPWVMYVGQMSENTWNDLRKCIRDFSGVKHGRRLMLQREQVIDVSPLDEFMVCFI